MVKKKAKALANFKNTIQEAPQESILEVDEVFSYVFVKVNQKRIWNIKSQKQFIQLKFKKF